jgi:uncharacterized protein (TIGR00251 family)
MTAAPHDIVTQATPPWIRIGRAAVTVEILARPGASRTNVLRVEPRGIVIGIAAPADKGKANAELFRFIAKLSGVARGAIEIARGETSRSKTVRISTSDPAAAAAKLLANARQK